MDIQVSPLVKKRRWLLPAVVIAAVVVVAVIGASLAMRGGQRLAMNIRLAPGGGATGLNYAAAPGAPSKAAYGAVTQESAGVAYDAAYAPSPMPVLPPTGGQTAAEVDQKIIKNGSLQLTVKDVVEAVSKITALAQQKGGFVQNSSVSARADGTHYGQISVRVPAKDFEQTVEGIKAFALTVNNETASGQDVTEQYTDLEAQLRNALAQEQTYLKVLDRAQTVEDILKVQQRLGDIRGTIESLQGRLKYLENVTAFSTITVTLDEEPVVQVPTKEFRPLTSLKEAVRSLVEALQQVVVAIIWLVVVGGGIALPFVLLGLLVALIVRKVRGKKRS